VADDREILDPVEALAALRAEFDDFRTTTAARLLRSPTGDIEPTLRSTAKPGTLLLQGATVNRADYPALWAWIVEQGLSPSVFGAGNGTTTFVLPDLRGRVLLGAGTLGADTYALGSVGGASSRVIATNQMPAHDHNVGINSVGGHQHPRTGGNRFTNTVGDHGGHCSGSSNVVPPGSGVTLPSFYGAGGGSHNHTVDAGDSSGGHNHGVTESTIGGSTGFDVRQPYFAGNWLIWY
jgi:microcystin-dependent protein